ncbi:hypothetical protein BDZ45DRAFT_698912 [Acephala macrosclerotiorum]|nr:hypothetical protein BDZ45DRAFT_698912 [Acephala macrosclerotiorum]
MAAREEDPEYRPPPEVDIFTKVPGHWGGTTEAQPEQAEASTSATTATTANDGKPEQKTISCVSCRRRKLKCDRQKPKCSTCTRLRHDCEYPERRRNLGSKRRNMKELEARLAQVETQLVSEQSKATTTSGATSISIEANWNDLTMDMDMNIDMGDDSLLDGTFNLNPGGFDFPPPGPSIPMGDLFSHELLELGLNEPLPPQEMMDELHQIYFDKFHKQVPMMHKYRYYISLSKSPQFRPPVCLRYAMWAIAASLSDKYRCYEDLLYERARRYIHDAEMKGHGESFVSVYHAQTWGLISNFEAKKTYFSRSWMSTGRMVRLCQMLGLYRLDTDSPDFKQILPAARDWIELEERRRTFWASYYGDRWASSGTGWPMLVDENEASPRLLNTCLRGRDNGANYLTSHGTHTRRSTASQSLRRCHIHLHKSGPDECPDDLGNGEFWKRHRKMDNVLSSTFMFLPDHLRLPTAARNVNVVFIHMNIHASAICLHQAAILTAEKHSLDKGFIQQSRGRCILAAEEIANIMRLICHVDPTDMHPWIGFCLYVACGVFIKDYKQGSRNPNAMTNLEFLLSSMKAIGTKHAITNHFTAQVELDMQAACIGKGPARASVESFTYPDVPDMPSLPINGILAERNGTPMTYANLQNFVTGKPAAAGPAAGVLAREVSSSSSPKTAQSPDVPSEPSTNGPSTNWMEGRHPIQDPSLVSVVDVDVDALHRVSRGSLNQDSGSNNVFDHTGLGQFSDSPTLLSKNAQGKQPSNSNTMQFPIRSSTPNGQQHPPGPGFPWQATGAIIGYPINHSDLLSVALKDPNSWTNLEGQNSENSQLQTGYPDDGDNSGVFCPFAERQRQGQDNS